MEVKAPTPPGTTASIGLLAWAHSSLAVDDLDAAVRFFERAFSFEILFTERGMSEQIASITGQEGMRCDLAQMRHAVTGHVLELIVFAPPGGLPSADERPVRPGASHVAFTVSDLGRAKQTIEELGAVTLGEVTSFAEGPAIYARIPGGAFIELDQPVKR